MKLLCPRRIHNIKRGYVQRTADAEKRIQISPDAVADELMKLRDQCLRKGCLTPEAEALLRPDVMSHHHHEAPVPSSSSSYYANPTTMTTHPLTAAAAGTSYAHQDPRSANNKTSTTVLGTGASFVVPTPARTTGPLVPTSGQVSSTTSTGSGNLNIHPDILRYLESRKKEEQAAAAASRP